MCKAIPRPEITLCSLFLPFWCLHNLTRYHVTTAISTWLLNSTVCYVMHYITLTSLHVHMISCVQPFKYSTHSNFYVLFWVRLTSKELTVSDACFMQRIKLYLFLVFRKKGLYLVITQKLIFFEIHQISREIRRISCEIERPLARKCNPMFFTLSYWIRQ